MKIRAKIRLMYKQGFSSSGCDVSVTKHEIKKILKSNCECDNCGISIFDMYDFPVFRDGYFLCEQCEIEKYYTTCPICQNSFEEATCAEGFKLLISAEAVEDYGMEVKPGFHLTNEWPFYYGNCVSGFEGIYPGSLTLVKECDINSMLKRLGHGSADENLNGEVCPECFKIWTGQQELVNNYCNQEYGAKYIALQKQVIEEGK